MRRWGATSDRKQNGQVLILAALAMAAMMGFAALTIDVGLYMEDRRHLQNTADAAALAGAADLPQNPALATAKAQEWALKHGIDAGDIKKIEVRSNLAANDTIYVEVEQQFNWIFGRVLGMTSDGVGAHAAARVGSLAGGTDFLPWALLSTDRDCLDSDGDPLFGETCVVKVGAGDATTGWYGALDPDGTGGGANEYVYNIIDGNVEWNYCIAGDPSPSCVGAHTTIADLDGNKTGPTDIGIEKRLAQGAKCDGNGNGIDDFSEVLSPNPGGDPTYLVSCPDSPWLIILPIVSYSGTPVQQVTINGWMLAYLVGYECVDSAKCGGTGHWEVEVQMVDAVYSQTSGFLGAWDSESAVMLRRLVE
ncbi:MAG TPA: pilus assembly protein TadG-related protein [Dehalococcoidia bacterium]|nr:pilus assembly protein TadG-related protein [Dehalococcoidia bacterium]